MPKNLNFASLMPERSTFTDIDGAVYDMISRADFSVVTMAKATRLQKQLPTWIDRLQKNPDDERAAELLEKGITEMVGMVIVGLPQERLDAMTLGQKQMILDFWNAQQAPEKQGETGEGKAGQAAS